MSQVVSGEADKITHGWKLGEQELDFRPPADSRASSATGAVPRRWLGWPAQVTPPVAAFLVATLGHLPVLGAFWNQDDWGLLGRAAGLVPVGFAGGLSGVDLPLRLVSQVVYWQLFFPLFGLAAEPYAATRLLLHGGSAALVARIAARAGLGPLPQLVAGVLFATTPLSFTPLYWASGVQELLGAFFALAAVERWLAVGNGRPVRGPVLAALLCGVLSILAKENGLGLPLLLAGLWWWRRSGRQEPAGRLGQGGSRLPVAALIVLALVAVAEAALVWGHFETGPGHPYALGSPATPLVNLAGYGWWLLSPGPFLATSLNLPRGLAGIALWVLWAVWTGWQWRRGRRGPVACLAGALLALAPVLPLATHVYPYLLYLSAAAGCLAIAFLLADRARSPQPLRPVLVLCILFVAAAWTWGGTTMRLKARDSRGLPADPVVLRTAVSFEAIQTIRSLPWSQTGQKEELIFVQPPPPGQGTELADRLGESWVTGSLLYRALEGSLGPRLVLADSVAITWANSLRTAPAEAMVLADGGPRFRNWGRTTQALLMLGLTEVARGQYERARIHLLRGAILSPQTMPFFYDPDQMLVSPAEVKARAADFRGFLAPGLDRETRAEAEAGPGRPTLSRQTEALLELFDWLLSVCCND